MIPGMGGTPEPDGEVPRIDMKGGCLCASQSDAAGTVDQRLPLPSSTVPTVSRENTPKTVSPIPVPGCVGPALAVWVPPVPLRGRGR